MKRDAFYREIWDGLGRDLDPDLFERCVGDLLRLDFPTLVPVRGGGDSGMDGAIADGEGPAFPLVCTTSDDVIGNLTKSLMSYLKDGGDPAEGRVCDVPGTLAQEAAEPGEASRRFRLRADPGV